MGDERMHLVPELMARRLQRLGSSCARIGSDGDPGVIVQQIAVHAPRWAEDELAFMAWLDDEYPDWRARAAAWSDPSARG